MSKPNSWGFLGYFNCTQPNCVFFVCLLLWGYETWWTRWFVANMWTWTPQEEMRGVRSTCWHEHGKSCSSKGAFTKITGRSPFRKGRELHQLEITIFGGSTLAVWILFMFKKMFFFQEISNSAKHVQVIQWGIFRRIDIDLTWSNILNYILIRNVGWFVTLWNFYMCTGMAL